MQLAVMPHNLGGRGPGDDLDAIMPQLRRDAVTKDSIDRRMDMRAALQERGGDAFG